MMTRTTHILIVIVGGTQHNPKEWRRVIYIEQFLYEYEYMQEKLHTH
jgi:hypothetical protein